MLHELVAQRLSDKGVGVWRPQGAYTSSDVGIFLEYLPDAAEFAIVLTTYEIETALEADAIMGLQVTVRALANDTREALKTCKKIKDALHAWEDYEKGIFLCWLQSGTSVGPDSRKRFGQVQNYYMTIDQSVE